MSKNETPTKVIVPCRFSYLHCWEPEAINGGEPKYSVSAIIPKSDKETIKRFRQRWKLQSRNLCQSGVARFHRI